jgi:hypothetical protein
MLELLNMDLKYDTWAETIDVFYTYLRNDSKIFKRFKNNPSSLKKVKFQENLLTAKTKDDKFTKLSIYGDEYQVILRFCAMILRYHG